MEKVKEEDTHYYLCNDGRKLIHKRTEIRRQNELNRQICSIQTEGHFGDIKENDEFRRFNYRSFKKTYKEFMIYLFGRNLNKYHKFIKGEIKEFKSKTAKIAA